LRFAVQDLAITTDKQVVRRIQTDISLWKNGLIDPVQALNQAKDEDEAQSARIYASYVATLSAYQAVDFDDLIRLPVELFRNNEKVRDKWQRRLRYLLMDEYQDTNTCQYELVKLMVTGIGKKPMFTAVGDDDQAIYAWRGASVENLKTLQTDFPICCDQAGAELPLHHAHPAGGQCGDRQQSQAVREIAVVGTRPGRADPGARHGHRRAGGRPGGHHDFGRPFRAQEQVVRLRDPVPRQPPGARDRACLRKERIPYTISGGQSFDKAEIKDIISYLRLLANRTTIRPSSAPSPRRAAASASRRWKPWALSRASGSARCSRPYSRAASKRCWRTAAASAARVLQLHQQPRIARQPSRPVGQRRQRGAGAG
jgi:ATP-dependent DNA helicase Rep